MTFLRSTAWPWLCLTPTLLIPTVAVVLSTGVGW